ncbi:MAG TPA: hypothetical protein VID19_00415 [Candidatus Eremiobacteraceae bacterium]
MRSLLIAAALVAFVLASSPRAAADQSAIAELNRQVAVTLRSVGDTPRRPPFVRPYSFGEQRMQTTGLPVGRAFVLPAWAMPLAHVDRLLHVHTGDFEFDGWSALVPRGVVRLKYTIRV